MLSAAPTFLPRIRSATTRTLRGVMRRYLRCAVASIVISWSPYFGAGAAGAAAGAGAPGAETGPPPVGALAFLSPVWPWKVRVGANSPSLWPTMFSVTNTGMNLRPLWTAKVWPTRSGTMVDRRDQVFTTFFWLLRFISSTFFTTWRSMNGPFFTERAIGYLTPLSRRLMMNLVVRLLTRVLYPLVGWPQGETGWGLPWPLLPSPPPCG